MIDVEDMHWMSEIESRIKDQLQAVELTVIQNQERVLDAFRRTQVSDSHLFGSTGYGLNDRGREQLETVFAYSFGAEAALVRPGIVSGTHALSIAFFALLRPGDRLLYATGAPYDTLEPVIGLRGNGMGSLREFGVTFDYVPLQETGEVNTTQVLASIDAHTTVVAFQRSPGYAWRRALSVAEIGTCIQAIKNIYPQVQIIVDNCYGEFTFTEEPPMVGADLTVGSLIKNPGGGLAPTGGYLVGSHRAVEAAAYRLTAPGLGAESGSYENHRLFFQGLFLAPHVVGEALKGNLFAAEALAQKGYEVAPSPHDDHGDIVLRIKLGNRKRLISFCQAVQRCSPIDSHVAPEPDGMPGYTDQVIMAAGAFVQGSSIELSADGPLREPYIAYLQGGLTYAHVKIAILRVLQELT